MVLNKDTLISLGMVGGLISTAVGYGKNENRISQLEKESIELRVDTKQYQRSLDERLRNLEIASGVPRYKIKPLLEDESK